MSYERCLIAAKRQNILAMGEGGTPVTHRASAEKQPVLKGRHHVRLALNMFRPFRTQFLNASKSARKKMRPEEAILYIWYFT